MISINGDMAYGLAEGGLILYPNSPTRSIALSGLKPFGEFLKHVSLLPQIFPYLLGISCMVRPSSSILRIAKKVGSFHFTPLDSYMTNNNVVVTIYWDHTFSRLIYDKDTI